MEPGFCVHKIHVQCMCMDQWFTFVGDMLITFRCWCIHPLVHAHVLCMNFVCTKAGKEDNMNSKLSQFGIRFGSQSPDLDRILVWFEIVLKNLIWVLVANKNSFTYWYNSWVVLLIWVYQKGSDSIMSLDRRLLE